jgi:hypothetical protein
MANRRLKSMRRAATKAAQMAADQIQEKAIIDLLSAPFKYRFLFAVRVLFRIIPRKTKSDVIAYTEEKGNGRIK